MQTSSVTLMWAGRAKTVLGNLDEALTDYRHALAITWEVDGTAGEAAILNNLGDVYRRRGELDTALDYCRQALNREVDDRVGLAATLSNIGRMHTRRGDLDTALDYYRQALPIKREIGARGGAAVTLNNIGQVHCYQQAHPAGDWRTGRRGSGSSRSRVRQSAVGEAASQLGGVSRC